MAEPQFEIWIRGKFRTKFQSNEDPRDAEACVALLRSQARRYRQKAENVVLKIRHKGRTKTYRAT